MDELITWLRGVLDEDERLVLMLPRAEWTWERNRAATLRIGETDVDVSDVRWAAHIERHDPASVLADIAAKRAILGLHNGDYPYDPDDGPGNYSWTARCQECHSEEPCKTLRLLASAYADRPGYLEEWRPRG